MAPNSSLGLRFDCGVEVTLSAAMAAPTAQEPQQVELTMKPHRERRSQKKAEVALRRERRFDQYSHLSHVVLGQDHAIYVRRYPGVKDAATKPVLKLERHLNLSKVLDLDAEMDAEAAAAAAGEQNLFVDFETHDFGSAWAKEAFFEETAGGTAFALPPPDQLDIVFPLPPSLQSSPRFGPSAPPPDVATEVAVEVKDNATKEAAEAREEAAAEEAELDGWVLVSPAQLPHQDLTKGGAVAQPGPTSLLHTLHSLVLGHGAAAVPHGPKEVAWVFVPPSRLRHAEPTAPLPSAEPSACPATAPDSAGSEPAVPTPATEATPTAPPGGGRAYLEAVLQQKPPLPKPPRGRPLPVRKDLRSPQLGGVRPLRNMRSQQPPTFGLTERHSSLLEPLAKQPRRDPRPRSLLMQRQRAFLLEKRAMQGAMMVAVC